MNIGRELWGSFAWHILHSFSINNNYKISNNKKHNYYIFYTSFIYILPCLICSEHYSDIIYNINELNEDDINRQYLMKWVFNAHNIVNKILHKPKYSYNNCIKKHKITNHKEIYTFMSIVLNNFNFEKMSLYKFDQIYNFFINFCLLYPELSIKKDLKKIINSESFKNIHTPLEFHDWIINNLINIKKIMIK